jgi:hypothetical protein
MGYNTYIHGIITVKLSVYLLYINKKYLFSKTKQEDKTCPVWGWHEGEEKGVGKGIGV